MAPNPHRAKLPLWTQLSVLGLVVWFTPTIVNLAQGPWGDPRNAHGPLIFLLALGLLGQGLKREWSSITDGVSFNTTTAGRSGFIALLTLGVCMFAIGRSQTMPALELGALSPILAAWLLTTHGWVVLRRQWFALVLIILSAPLPAVLVDSVTQPMKLGASVAADHLLHALNYPVAREGVTLTVGPYRLLVADACAGLKSLFVLETLGLIYVRLMAHPSHWRNIILMLACAPLAFIANTLRIVLLALLTYHGGDELAQGWLHSFSGLFLFMVALGGLFALDTALGQFKALNKKKSGAASVKHAPIRWPHMAPTPAVLLLAAALTGAMLARSMAPTDLHTTANFSLTTLFPDSIGEWTQVQAPLVQMSLSNGPSTDSPYDQQWTGTYRNPQGKTLMVALAYVERQTQDIKVHKPETCYTAQGLSVASLPEQSFNLPSIWQTPVNVPLRRFEATNPNRHEIVSYWMKTGRQYLHDGLDMRKAIFLSGLKGHRVEGVLVRVSNLDWGEPDAAVALQLHQSFLKAWLESLEPEQRRHLIVES